ncbi:MAG: transcriptional regulator [Gammaproteobacteria bacterium]|nr:transcriptional regulator [Gammaproteobacteria bacterium]MDH4255206.1 transcriptional regulator [Gammaproteobacteria bacterium]MDH5308776.1 transcriptional regulator [Gammaproteobacteria bacterium]
MADPKCPACSASGIDKVVSAPSVETSREGTPWFFVAHCSQCGNVYGIFTKHVFGRGGPRLIVENR